MLEQKMINIFEAELEKGTGIPYLLIKGEIIKASPEVDSIIVDNILNCKAYDPQCEVVTEGFTFEIAPDYSINSELIIKNPKKAIFDCWKDEIEAGEKIPEWCITEYYRFENEKLTMIKQVKPNLEQQ